MTETEITLRHLSSFTQSFQLCKPTSQVSPSLEHRSISFACCSRDCHLVFLFNPETTRRMWLFSNSPGLTVGCSNNEVFAYQRSTTVRTWNTGNYLIAFVSKMSGLKHRHKPNGMRQAILNLYFPPFGLFLAADYVRNVPTSRISSAIQGHEPFSAFVPPTIRCTPSPRLGGIAATPHDASTSAILTIISAKWTDVSGERSLCFCFLKTGDEFFSSWLNHQNGNIKEPETSFFLQIIAVPFTTWISWVANWTLARRGIVINVVASSSVLTRHSGTVWVFSCNMEVCMDVVISRKGSLMESDQIVPDVVTLDTAFHLK